MPIRNRLVAAGTGLVLLLIGAAVLGAGAWLIDLGGSPYYAVAGAGFMLTGVLLLLGNAVALIAFAALLLGTLLWALAEIGLDWWPLAARGDVMVPLALWLLTPWVAGKLGPGGTQPPRAYTLPLWCVLAISAVVLCASLLMPQHDIKGALDMTASAALDSGGMPAQDWRAYGRTGFGQRYSPLTDITPANAKNLTVAWTFQTGDWPGKNDPLETTFEVTPIKAHDTLYLCSQHQRVFAVDAASGKKRWSFDPHLADNATFQHLTCRGVSYYEAPDAALTAATPGAAPSQPQTACASRIFFGTNDGRLFSLDAATGQPCRGFGNLGVVDLQVGMPVTTAGDYEVTSPPVITDHLVIVNGAVRDNYSTAEPSGVIRAFDVNSGALVWAWDAGNADENALPSAGRTYVKNSPNSWMTMSYDAKLGLLYVPMGVQTPDIWGGNREPVAERYSSALVALDANTGHRVWSYQTVHHDLWDMDLPAQPTLLDMPTPKGIVPAILQPAKTGNLFVLDRRDGHLLVPAPERNVPQGASPGDRTSPTQPFSALTFRPQHDLTEADMWGATLFDQLACRIEFRSLRYQGIFTPPSLQGTLVFPGNLGMFEWGGIAVDPVRQIAIANPITMPFVSQLLPRGPGNPPAPNGQHPPGGETGVQPMYGTPYGVKLHAFLSPLHLPCMRPPWGYMAAVDLKTDKIVWMHKNGTIRDSAPVPIPIKMGVPSLGGPLVTAGGVAFLTSTADYYIRAYDVRTGDQLWQDRLPAGGQSTPMSYAVGNRQFVVTAAGGHGSFGSKAGDYVIAYGLP